LLEALGIKRTLNNNFQKGLAAIKSTFFSWIYSLGVSIMMFGYNRMSDEERRETFVYKYVNGSSWTEDKIKQMKKTGNNSTETDELGMSLSVWSEKGEMLIREIK
jgi:hypothetical protein